MAARAGGPGLWIGGDLDGEGPDVHRCDAHQALDGRPRLGDKGHSVGGDHPEPALGVGGHLTALRRTRIGSYLVEEAKTLEETLEITSMEDAARNQFDSIDLDAQQATDLVHGKRLKAGENLGEPVAAFAPDGRLLAMLTRSGSQYKSLVVFPEVSK